MGIGVNALMQYVSDRDRIQQTTASAGVAVIMDDPAYARSLAAANPRAVVVHRSYRDDDHRLHETVTPGDWLQSVALTAGNGVIVQALNEPSGYTNLPALVTWCVEVMKQAHERGIPLCLPNFAVGHPDTALVESGVLDPLLRAFVAYPEMRYGCHEYWRDDPLNEPYHVGRFHAILDRCRVLGITPPRIMVTEFGRDHSGGIADGWRGVGYSEREYADLLTRTHARVYAPYGIPAAVFCYGRGADNRWASFDVEDAETVLQTIEEYNSMTYQPGTHKLIKLPGQWLNIRAAANTSAAKVGELRLGDVVTVVADTGDGWLQLDRGYVSLLAGAVEFAPFTPPIPDAGTVYSEGLTDDELDQLIKLYEGIAGIYRAVQARRAA